MGTDDELTDGPKRGRAAFQPRKRETASPSWVHWMALTLVAITGLIHLYVGWARGRPSLAVAGLGFFGGLALFLAGYRQRLLYALGIGYVTIQIVLWAVFNAGEYTLIGYVDKAVQVGLLGALATLLRTASN